MKKAILSTLLVLLYLSASAQRNTVNEPIRNFEVLWSTFNERYANFELKKVDWQAVYEKYRPQIHASSTNEELYLISCAMLQELKDGHVSLDPGFEDEIDCGPPYHFLYDELLASEEDQKQFKGLMEKSFRTYGFSDPVFYEVSEETHFQYRLSENFAYLRLDEMTERFPLNKLKQALDASFEQFEGKQGLIIDLRFNGGGWDVAAYKIAARLVNQKILGHYKKQRIKGTNSFGKLKPFYLKPEGNVQFTRPVVILTSDYTASAAEVFLLALKELPHIKLVGDTTEGIFSDMYEFKLPNNWEVSLSHQQFFSRDMLNYEGKGIPPDFNVVNAKGDKVDVVLEKGLEVLTQAQTNE
ncbi:MAG: S41 family peptidase [Bacteroidota bacterium]